MLDIILYNWCLLVYLLIHLLKKVVLTSKGPLIKVPLNSFCNHNHPRLALKCVLSLILPLISTKLRLGLQSRHRNSNSTLRLPPWQSGYAFRPVNGWTRVRVPQWEPVFSGEENWCMLRMRSRSGLRFTKTEHSCLAHLNITPCIPCLPHAREPEARPLG